MVLRTTFLFCLIISQVGWLCASSSGEKAEKEYDLLVVTVATEETDGFKRFMRSTNKYGVNVKVVGMGVEWNGGDIQRWPGGGQKINLLKQALEEHKDNDNLIILFSDSYDVIFTTGEEEIVGKFLQMNANLVFSAENSIWPDPSLASQYPKPENGYPFLCSGLYMGYAPYFWSALTYSDIGDKDDDQLFYTQLYLSPARQDEWGIKLDHLAELFMNLNGARGDVKLLFEGANSMLQNVKYQTVPAIIHGNGPSKILLNTLGNYLANYWTRAKGCLACGEGRLDLRSIQEKDYPTVMIALFIEQNSPFIDDYFNSIEDLEYPKDKIHLFIHVNVMLHYHHAKDFAAKWESDYVTTKVIIPAYGKSEGEARNEALDLMNQLECDYMFTVDSNVRLNNPEILKLLIEQNRPVIAPLVNIPDKLWSNFWGDINADGFYARSDDYIDILKGNRKGIWNVPFVSSVYLIMGKRVRPPNTPSFTSSVGYDADMTFCSNLRNKGIFMYVMNIYEAGRILNMEDVETTHLHNDMWQIATNPKQWEDKYIPPGYWEARKPDTDIEEVCPDVFKFPLMSETYADHLVEEMENFGQWSSGQNQDSRLEGGYENVPTRDIHMNQIGYERHWLYFLSTYVGPVCEKLFWGYSGRHFAIMNFVVRYRPDEQPALRPHHDSSTYTINVALNTQGKDYEGGGARFTRYNCSCIGLEKGWTLMHPGKLTHQHEGLPTTNGTRYIMISFIDP
ncbi:Procollagen-lysine,2-oxoglutarate 5-dioxygenase 1 [Holothuria leucospilota]|uniref:procollagen-lysine 5-dioxygenase n=1 Tax=Holothuria leucospilota TaxID=206669 RepID=A0A9Q0YFN5_HOLLE|nr:Procollagen-lysine,2-oxoglutarate 5-dioxygenase 1 [Holothuria leucospilota]